MFEPGEEFAADLDASDPLASMRDEFHHPRTADGSPITYLVGNSLGLQPKRTARIVNEELDKWASTAVAGHFASERPWLSYHELLAPPVAAMVGAEPHEVVTMNSLTVNLHLLMVSFYRPQGSRRKILLEHHAFPSDHFAIESQVHLRGLDPAEEMIAATPRQGEETLRTTDLIETIVRTGDELAMVLLPGVQYYTGQVLDMAAITEAAHSVGADVGFDLAHAIGNVSMDLHSWGVDFAAWCTYKYLNAGPGSVGGAFVHERHHRRTDLPRLHGWWGHDKGSRFEMRNEFMPIPTVEAWQLSNAPILSMAPLVASLEVFAEAGGMAPLRSKAEQMVGYLDFLLATHLPGTVRNLTPVEISRRGCQSSLQISSPDHDGRAVFDGLIAANVECDWRHPDVIRVAPVPLYNTYTDIHRFVSVLTDLLS